MPDVIGASTFHDFFESKVDNIRDAMAGADLPTFQPAPAGCELSVFSPVTVDELHTAIRRL